MREKLSSFFYSAITGLIAGLAVSIFLFLLGRVTGLHGKYPAMIFTLPFVGVLIAFFYHRYDEGCGAGNALVLDTIHKDDAVIPLRMAPFVLISTLLSHLGGGSVGREGTAVQMSASLSDQFARILKLDRPNRRALVLVGVGAGFAAAFGTPIAGAMFGLEVIAVGSFEWTLCAEALIAAYAAYYCTHLLGIVHTKYPTPEILPWQSMLPFLLAIAALSFGVAAQAFVTSTHFLEKKFKKWIRVPELRAFLVGCLLVALFRWEGSGRFEGLGFQEIFHSFSFSESLNVPLMKGGFTALTLSGGFKGGEFIPLVFIGTTLGSFLAPLLQLPISSVAALGLTACFGAVANTPLTAALLLGESFGWKFFPYALFVSYLAYFVTGEQGIYRGQRIHRRKPITLLIQWWKARKNY